MGEVAIQDLTPYLRDPILAGAQQPVILLVDNDDGAKGKGGIYNTIKDITKTMVMGTEPFVHVTGNLYLVATPLKPGAVQSMIEDFF
jgi:hypothetical protein